MANQKETPEAQKQLVQIKDIPTGERFPDAYESFSPNEIEQAEQLEESAFLFTCQNRFALKISIYEGRILRFRYAPESRFEPDFSYSLDPSFEQSEGSGGAVMEDKGSHYSIQNQWLECRVQKDGLKVSVYDKVQDHLLCEDVAPVSVRRTISKGIDKVQVSKMAPPQAAYFGLGDKSCAGNLRRQKLQNWNTDAFGYQKETDPLYRSIPFYYSIINGFCHGIFFHNTHRTHFDFAQSEKDKLSFWAEGGEIDYFLLTGSSPVEVAQQYHRMTGTPELPPLWSLGFHQCRWSYYPEERVREVAQEFRDRKIPCDAIYLDIDYMDGYRCFTWDKEHFPDPKGLIADLRNDGFQTVVMIDPGIRVDKDYHVYKEGMEKDVFCYRSSGEIMRGPVWPPDCVFPDFTKPETREWWGPLYRELYEEQGVSGFWNDMNEPAVFMVDSCTFPDQVVHEHDGHRCDHRRAHNIYGQQMTRATFDGLKGIKPGKRPFVLTRATFSGGQRYASAWTGDNVASWEHLRLANIQCQRMSISGFSFVGTDIGGFKDQPDGELMVRWLQLGAFHPLFRVHSMGNNVDGAAEADAEMIHEAERTNRLDQEPWSFGEEYTKLARQAIEFRYQLLPYLYTAFWQYVNDGLPILRPLFFHSPGDEAAVEREEEFLFGNQLLVFPVLEAGADKVAGYLPEGQWLDYWTGKTYEGKQTLVLDVSPDRIPVLVKAGAVIPNYPVMQYTGEKAIEEVTLRVYHGSDQSFMYEDEGEGYGYRENKASIREYRTEASDESLKLRQSKSSDYKMGYKRFRLQFFGLPFSPAECTVDGHAVNVVKQELWQYYEVVVPEGFEVLEVKG